MTDNAGDMTPYSQVGGDHKEPLLASHTQRERLGNVDCAVVVVIIMIMIIVTVRKKAK